MIEKADNFLGSHLITSLSVDSLPDDFLTDLRNIFNILSAFWLFRVGAIKVDQM